MKVGIIGGGGRVGVSFAFHLLTTKVAREIVLIDVLRDVAEGEALDLTHATSTIGNVKITHGWIDAADGCDVVVITAGARRKADETRLQLIQKNVTILDSTIDELLKVSRDAIILVVANPVDVLTYRALVKSGLSPKRVFGLGTVMDTVRFRSLLAARFGWNPTEVQAFLLGEHGDAMVPIWSRAVYSGMKLTELPGVTKEALDEVFQKTKTSGADVIRLKGGAGWAVGVSISEVVVAIATDSKKVLPVSTLPQGAYGIDDVCLSLPTIVGKDGAEGHIVLDLAPEEMAGLKKSAEVLKQTYAQV
jgi:L-lactate dehydrogenase